jgi:hypothetical protein
MTGFVPALADRPTVDQEREKLRAALDGYAAVDIGNMLEALSPGASANRRKAERVEVLVRLLTDPTFAPRALGTLTPLGRRLLGVARRGGRTSVAALLLAGQDAAHDEETVRREVQGLVGLAQLIVEGRGTNGSKVSLDLSQPAAAILRVWVPQLLLDALAALTDDLPPLTALRTEPASVEQGSFALLRRDLYLALRFLKGTGLRLTRVGEPHRADLRKLLAALQPGPAPGRRDADAAQVEGRIVFLLRLLDAAGLTVATENQLRADDGADAFLNEAEPDAARLLYEAWLDLSWNEFQRLPHLVVEPWSYSGPGDVPQADRIAAARRAIADLLAAAPAGWVSVAALSDHLRQTDPEFLIDRVPEFPPSYYSYYNYYGYDSYYGNRQVLEQTYYRGFARSDLRSRDRRLRKDQDWAEVEGAFIAQVVGESLRWLGLTDVGYERAGKRAESDLPQAVRLTDLGQRLLGAEVPEAVATTGGVALVVQPNFEVLVLDALAHLDLVARLDAFADSHSLDRAAVYRLTRTSIVRGLAAGWTEERIVATLEGAAGAELPQNVRHTIADWSREYERVHLYRDAAILEAPDAATLDRWLADPALAPHLPRRLTPTVALVRNAGVNEAATLLDRRGVELWSINYALDPPQVVDLPKPDTIAITPEDDDPYLRYRLDRFADMGEGGEGRGATYRISPASLARAKAGGQTIDEVLSFLGYKARAGLSPDDVLTLRGWSGYYEPFQWAQVRAVELPPTANWGDLSRVKALRPLILRILTSGLALVAEEHWPQLEAALTARGIVLKAGLNVQPQAEKRSAAQKTAASLGLPTGRDLADGRVVALRPTGGHQGALQRLSGRPLVDFIESALDAEQAIVIEYQKPSERRATVRTVEPRELEMRGGSYYLHGFCRSRQEERVFRLSNVLGVALAAD